MIVPHTFQLLSHDVAPLGLLSAPLISWCGSAGLAIFFLWQLTSLYLQSTQTAEPFSRASQQLANLAHEREQLDQESFAVHPPGAAQSQPRTTTAQLDRRDVKDFQRIDAVLQREPWLSQAWKQYRKTLVTEQVAWYIEPRIFSSRSAQELFSLETIFRGRLNLSWYQQVPSLLTGIGLLLTFMALLVGLSKLHADGHGIAGIQGLINGLAGKFLTSIVGLVCATLFTVIEKPLMFRLLSAHQRFTHLIDDLFPRKTLEQILEGMTGTPRRPLSPEAPSRHTAPPSYVQASAEMFTQPLKTMTQSMDSLTRELRAHLLTVAEHAPSAAQQTTALAEALAPLIQQLTAALKQVPQRLEPPPERRSSSSQHVNHLVDDLTARITRPTSRSLTKPVSQSHSWLQRLRSTTNLTTALSTITHDIPGTSHTPR